MITISDINRQYYPEIVNCEVEDCRERQLAIKFVRWLTCEALSLFERPIKLIAILCLWWPVDLYG
ncbi:hypothetical protein KAR91_36725 [Candidatus Pacearchaeota archaeon]|nr:hypothetical protein [Candidatus Pacearchaeota archaeon]